MPGRIRLTAKFLDCALLGLFYFQREIVTLGFGSVKSLPLDRGLILMEGWGSAPRLHVHGGASVLHVPSADAKRWKSAVVYNSKSSKLESDFNTCEERKYSERAQS